MTAPYTAAELAAILARAASITHSPDWKVIAATVCAQDVPRLIAELTQAREAIQTANEIIRTLTAEIETHMKIRAAQH